MKSLNIVLVLFAVVFCACGNNQQTVVVDSPIIIKNANLISFDHTVLRDSSSADSGLPTTRISKISIRDTIELKIEYQANGGCCLDADIDIRNDTIWPHWWDTCHELIHSLEIYELQFMISDSGIHKDKLKIILPE